MGAANASWAEMLRRWAIPDEVMAGAPEPPYFFDPKVFSDAADDALARSDDTPSDIVAREALPAGGSVIDVGCGAGAASLRLQPGRLVGVDSSPPLLDAFVTRAGRLGIHTTAVEGVWPDAEASLPAADVVVCHHVVYNVPDLAAFASALHEHARRRVIIELTAVHSMAWATPYWTALYGLDRPDRPVAEDAIAVLQEAGFTVRERRWSRPYQVLGEQGEQAVRRLARRLCLPPSRHDELRKLLVATPPPDHRDVVTLWWD